MNFFLSLVRVFTVLATAQKGSHFKGRRGLFFSIVRKFIQLIVKSFEIKNPFWLVLVVVNF